MSKCSSPLQVRHSKCFACCVIRYHTCDRKTFTCPQRSIHLAFERPSRLAHWHSRRRLCRICLSTAVLTFLLGTGLSAAAPAAQQFNASAPSSLPDVCLFGLPKLARRQNVDSLPVESLNIRYHRSPQAVPRIGYLLLHNSCTSISVEFGSTFFKYCSFDDHDLINSFFQANILHAVRDSLS